MPLEITTRQRAALRSEAHSLEPVVRIGKEGVTDQTIHSIRDAFRNRTLLKIRVLEAAPEGARDTARLLADRMEDVAVVQVIGRIVVLYCPEASKRN